METKHKLGATHIFMNGMITVVCRGDDWKAHVTDHKEMWEASIYMDVAIGGLIRNFGPDIIALAIAQSKESTVQQ